MKRWIVLIAIVLAALTCTDLSWGQMPTAVITGPKEARPGSLVVLDASESQGLARTWLLAVSPEPTSFWMPDSKLQLLFASPTPGDYTFVLVVAGVNPNGGPAADMATHTVHLPRPSPPVPPEDPPADPTKPPSPVQRATAALYIYEKDQGSPPPAVTQALHRLNTERESFVASAVDDDITTGKGAIPAQFQAAIGAARAAGLPALVILAGDQVLQVLRDPRTETAVMEAVQQ